MRRIHTVFLGALAFSLFASPSTSLGSPKEVVDLMENYREKLIELETKRFNKLGLMEQRGKLGREVFGDLGEGVTQISISEVDLDKITISYQINTLVKSKVFERDDLPEKIVTSFCLLNSSQLEAVAKLRRSKARPLGLDETSKIDFSHIVILTGDQGVGTGFLVNTEGRSWIYTAAHVVSGNKKITIKSSSGQEYKDFDLFQTAKGFDMMRLRLRDNVEEALELSDEVGPGLQIAAIGNGGGEGVVGADKGKIIGLSDGFFEVSAKIIQGNSGCPIIDLKTGKVVAVATHLSRRPESVWTEGTRYSGVRRFGARVDVPQVWLEQPIGSFIKEGIKIGRYDSDTKIIWAFLELSANRNGLRLADNHKYHKEILATLNEHEDHHLIKYLYKVNRTMADRSNASMADIKRQLLSILRRAQALAKNTQQDLKLPVRSHYHTKEIEASLKWRKELVDALSSKIANMK